MSVRLRRAAVTLVGVAALVTGPGLVSSAVAAPSDPVPFPRKPHGLSAPVALPDELDAAAGWTGQVSCNPVLMRGVRMLRDLALQTYAQGYDGGVARSCVVGGSSEHKEGRAWDWMLDVNNPAQKQAAGDFLAWLTQKGSDGTPGVKARRLGVMYVIYNRKMWRAYDPGRGWTAYTGSSPHTDHIHISLGWAGARGNTSFWTGRAAGPDYGPCVVFAGQPAPISRRANPEPCGSPAALVKTSFRPIVQYGASGLQAVRAGQRLLGLTITGDFDRRTWRAVKGYQRTHDLPVTGALDKPTWASLAPASVRSSALEGFGPRRAARYAASKFSHVRLSRGSAGAAVAFLQTALRLPVAYRNGVLARHTAAAVRGFKVARGMARNAVVNPRVWREIAGR